MPSKQIKYFRIQRSSGVYKLCIIQAFFFSKTKIIKEQLYSQILELRITFISLSKNMIYEYYLTQPKPMLEWKLLAMLDKNRENVCLNIYGSSSHPLLREYLDI